MTEKEARRWAEERWSRSAIDRLELFSKIVAKENDRQNLVSASSLLVLWSRHITDSLQLVPLAENRDGLWIDVGTGGGFPGMMVAAVREGEILLVEPRRRRADFLRHAIDAIGLKWASVAECNIEDVTSTAAVLSARAVAAPQKLFELTTRVRDTHTLFLLPGGRTALRSLDDAKRTWKGVFHVKQSITDPGAKIIVASAVSRK